MSARILRIRSVVASIINAILICYRRSKYCNFTQPLFVQNSVILFFVDFRTRNQQFNTHAQSGRNVNDIEIHTVNRKRPKCSVKMRHNNAVAEAKASF
jgi:hypothetical protein